MSFFLYWLSVAVSFTTILWTLHRRFIFSNYFSVSVHNHSIYSLRNRKNKIELSNFINKKKRFDEFQLRVHSCIDRSRLMTFSQTLSSSDIFILLTIQCTSQFKKYCTYNIAFFALSIPSVHSFALNVLYFTKKKCNFISCQHMKGLSIEYSVMYTWMIFLLAMIECLTK